MSKILINTTVSPIVIGDTGVTIPGSSNYTIPPQDYLLWSSSTDILTPVGDEDIVVNDGSFDLSPSDGIDLIKGIFPTSGFSNFFVVNFNITLANTEYSYTLPSGTRAFEFKLRDVATLKFSDTSGQSGTTYVTVPPGTSYSVTNRKSGSTLPLYFQATSATQVLELIYWT